MTSAVSTASCPRCQRTDLTALAREEDRQRYQCNACDENFTAPAAAEIQMSEEPSPETRVAHLPISIPEPDASGIAGKCPKCLKPYYRLGKKFDEHVASCDGTPFVPKEPRKPRAAALPAAALPTAASPPETVPPVPLPASATPAELTKAFGISIEALKMQRAVLEAEIQSLNGVIATLEKLRGPGGASPSTPFRHGA